MVLQGLRGWDYGILHSWDPGVYWAKGVFVFVVEHERPGSITTKITTLKPNPM